MTVRLISTLLFVLLSQLTLADGDIDAGRNKSRLCVGCHGVAGISNAPVYPNLAGQKEAYLVSALQAYKSRDRQGGGVAPLLLL